MDENPIFLDTIVNICTYSSILCMYYLLIPLLFHKDLDIPLKASMDIRKAWETNLKIPKANKID